MHNYWFNKYSIEATYSLLNIKEQEIETIIKKIKEKELSGVNVTLPYKQKIIPFIGQLVNDAKSTNSVNTIFLDDNETVIGDKTVVFGLLAAYFKEISGIENKKVLVIGAGGVSPSIIFSLQKSKTQDISCLLYTSPSPRDS